MADSTEGADAKSADDKKAEKRQSTDGGDDAPLPKKISISFGASKPKPLANQKISFNLSSGEPKTKTLSSSKPAPKITSAPIKMSLNASTKPKEPLPVVQKTATTAKIFDDSDESDEEEMPPEARMRMKNIGRNTPTASGPNSYGKGKMGFIDRHKILEKQLKEDMEKISGDKPPLS